MSTFYSLKIKELKKETNNAVSIVFDVPTEKELEFQFVAGQYITIQKELNGQELRRAYSICSSPKSNELKVAVKAVENGTFSVYATSELKTGDILDVAKPEGKFVLQPQPNKNYIAFCAGSGITPVLSMVKATLENEPIATFTLVYGNKSVADTIFYEELSSLKLQYPSQLNLHYVFSQEQQDNALLGRIDKNHTNHFLKDVYVGTEFSSAFLCGPEEMINIVSETLKENGFAPENIHFELFTASISVDESAVEEIKDGKATIRVVLDDEETTFTMEQTDTILAASLRNKIDAPYSCQGGVCSSCIAKVTEGKAVMTRNQILTDDELEDGFILTCQAHPTTAKIVVDFDDV